MTRPILSLLACLLSCSVAEAQSLREEELHQLLRDVARQSSAGTPRAINEDLLDRGYRAEGNVLINAIGVQPAHAAQMRDNPDAVREQLTESVCANQGLRQLLARGAVLRFEFGEHPGGRAIASERFVATDCGL